MSERAHPEDPAFQDRWTWEHRFKGLIPIPNLTRSPWKRGLIRRYEFCHAYSTGKAVLEIPCGVGWGTSLLKNVSRLTAVDLSHEAVQYGKMHYGRDIEFLVGDMGCLPFSNDSFDLVICLEGIEHVPKEIGSAFIHEAARVLKLNGKIILTSPLPDHSREDNPYHVHEYELEELESIIQTRFQRELLITERIGSVNIVFYVGQIKLDIF